MLKLCKIGACPNGTLGLHLSRAPWDPYPWVSGVQEGSSAFQAGVRTGDILLELNGFDVLGQKISELASRIRSHWESGGSFVCFLIWRCKNDQNGINQQSLQKFATCLQNIAQLLECPVCLEVVKPPGWQCCNGHVLCNSCRDRTVKCPICRVTLGPRGRCLLSDKLFTLLAETFPCDDKKPEDNGRCPDRRASAPAKITSPEGSSSVEEKQIISIKVDFKSPQPVAAAAAASGVEPIRDRLYQCPTGKSCGSPEEDDGDGKMVTQWDVLTHLRRVHRLSVVQYYGTYGECIQVEFMNKSIPCISIATVRLPVNASSTPQNVSAIPLNPTQVMPGGLLKHPATTTSPLLVEKVQGVELFFVARVPIEDDAETQTIGHERCAIFIWYCGTESNVKKFQAVIECKRSGTKWTGCIHSMTTSWSAVHRRREFLQLKFDAADFLDVVIKIK